MNHDMKSILDLIQQVCDDLILRARLTKDDRMMLSNEYDEYVDDSNEIFNIYFYYENESVSFDITLEKREQVNLCKVQTPFSKSSAYPIHQKEISNQKFESSPRYSILKDPFMDLVSLSHQPPSNYLVALARCSKIVELELNKRNETEDNLHINSSHTLNLRKRFCINEGLSQFHIDYVGSAMSDPLEDLHPPRSAKNESKSTFTVRVRDWLYPFPIRKACFLNFGSSKILLNIKYLLQSMMLNSSSASFSLYEGFSFKALLNSNIIANSTICKNQRTIRETFSLLFGMDRASQLMHLKHIGEEYKIESLITSPDANSALENSDHFQFLFIENKMVHLNDDNFIHICGLVNEFYRKLKSSRNGRVASGSILRQNPYFPCFVIRIDKVNDNSKLNANKSSEILLIPKIMSDLMNMLCLYFLHEKSRDESSSTLVSERKTSRMESDSEISISKHQTKKRTRCYRKHRIMREDLLNLKIISQWDKKFILVSVEDHHQILIGNGPSESLQNIILCIDQHAAHERILLEYFRDLLDSQLGLSSSFSLVNNADADILSSDLPINDDSKNNDLEDKMIYFNQASDYGFVENPYQDTQIISKHHLNQYESVEINQIETDLLNEHNRMLRMWGFEWTISTTSSLLSSQTTIVVTSVPMIFGYKLKPVDIVSFIHELKSTNHPKPIRLLLASMACRKAIKFGDILSPKQIQDLVRWLPECKNPFQCAHGRPSIVPLDIKPFR